MVVASDVPFHDPRHSDVAPRRILIVSATVGEGHNATGRALEREARRLWPDAEVKWVDTLRLLGPGIGPLTRWAYVMNVEATPWLYESLYELLWRNRPLARLAKEFVGGWTGRRLAPVVTSFDPDIIISTYPLGTGGLAWLRRHRGLSAPVGAWVSDFAPHPFWVYADVDLTYVMHPSVAPLARHAVPGANVEVSALPVAESFTPADRAAARRALGLPTAAFIVVLATGFYGFGSVENAVDALLDADPRVQVIAMCANNDRMRRALEERHLPPHRLLALPWTDQVAGYIVAADAVVSNAGGATALETLASGRLLLMYRPIAAQGKANADLLVRAGLAIPCTEPDELADAVAHLAAHPREQAGRERTAARYAARRIKADDLRRLAAAQVPRAPARPRALPPPPRSLRPEDAFFLWAQNENVTQQVGAVLLLDAGASPSERPELVRRAANILHRRRLSPGKHWWSRPQWVASQPVNAELHVKFGRLGEAGEADSLRAAIDRFFSAPLHGLWDLYFVDGLPDGGSALLVKVHHALGDSFAVARTLIGLLDPLPVRRRVPSRRRSISPPAPVSLAGRVNDARVQARTRLRAAGRIAAGLWRLASAGPAPGSGINGPMSGGKRRFVWFNLPSREVMSTARKLHAGSTTFVLSVVGAAIGEMLRERGEPTTTSLRMMVPRTVRSGSSKEAAGNWTAAVSIEVPIREMAPRDRLRVVQRRLESQLRGGAPEAANWVMRMMGVLPAPLHAAAARAIYNGNWFNLIVSVFPGHRLRRTLLGAPVREVYPVLPVADEVGLAIGVMTWGEVLSFGITADVTLVPEADRFAEAVRGEYEVFRSEAG